MMAHKNRVRATFSGALCALFLLLIQVRASQSRDPVFSFTLGKPRWEYIETGAGSGSSSFPAPKYCVRVPVQVTARLPLPVGKTVRDYIVSDFLLSRFDNGTTSTGIRSYIANENSHPVGYFNPLLLSNVSPRGGEVEVEFTMKRPDRPAKDGERRETLEFTDVPIEVEGDAAQNYRRVASDGSAIQLRSARRGEKGQYKVIFHVRTPPPPVTRGPI